MFDGLRCAAASIPLYVESAAKYVTRILTYLGVGGDHGAVGFPEEAGGG